MENEYAALDALFDANPSAATGIASVYQILLGGLPTVAGFTSLINNAVATNFGSNNPSIVFNEENIYINLANALVVGNADSRAAFTALTGGATTLAAQVTAIYNAVIPAAQQTDAGRAFLTRPEALQFYTAVAAERDVPGADGPAVVALASLLKIYVDENFAVGNSVNDFIQAIGNGTAQLPQAGDAFTPVETADGTAFDADDAGVGGPVGATFTLTPGQDFADQAGAFRNGSGNPFDFQFTTANETVVASNTTLTTGDALSDASTTDEDILQTTAAGATPLNFQTVGNIENINIEFSAYTGATVQFAGVTGAQTVDLNGTLEAVTTLATLANTGITLVDGSGLTSTTNGINVDFSTAAGGLSRTILGGEASDNLDGSPVGDTISGNNGGDSLDGFGGDDTLRGGGGNDDITTGGGINDIIVFEASADANGVDTIGTNTAITFTPGANGDQLDFTAFIGGPASVLEVPTNAVGGDGVVATAANVIVFDLDADIDTEAEIEANIGTGAGDINIGASRNVVLLIESGGNTQAYYATTNGAGEVSADTVDQVALLTGATSASFTDENFV